MIDRDLADLYHVETKVLNQAVTRNIKRFEGDDFMFRLTKDEAAEIAMRSQIATTELIDNENHKASDTSLRSQIVTTNQRGGRRNLPYAFTELGVAMLSSVLRSETAIRVNRDIMRAFVALRHLASAMPKTDMVADVSQLRRDFDDLKRDIEDILADQNEINEDTRIQLELINQSLAQLQSTSRPPRRPVIGFRRPEEKK